LNVTLAVAAEKPLIPFAVFARFDGFELAIMAGHFELAFPDGLAQNADAIRA